MSDLVLGGLLDEPRVMPRTSVMFERFEQLEELPLQAELLVPLVLWLAPGSAEQLSGRSCLVLLTGADDPLALSDRLSDVSAIAIQFADFNDGRGYSQAVLLRTRLGFTGQLRAVGDVLRDQLFLYLRCGFDAFEPRADRDTETFLLGYHEFREVYQRSVTSQPLFTRRDQALQALKVAS